MGSRLLLENVEERNFVRHAESEYETVESAHIHDGAGREPSSGSRVNSSFEARAKNIQLASRLNAANLEIEELRLKVMQKDCGGEGHDEGNSGVGEAGSVS